MVSPTSVESCTSTNYKKFWTYIKSLHKDDTGIPPLEVNSVVITDSKQKAEALNRQFQSVFTAESSSDLPDKGISPFSTMPQIQISEDGIKKQLQDLNVHKAIGPDNIPARFLKETSYIIAPILTESFKPLYQLVTYLVIGRRQVLHQSLRKVVATSLPTTAQYLYFNYL